MQDIQPHREPAPARRVDIRRGSSRGGSFCLKRMQEVRRALSMRGRSEDRARVVLQDLD